MSGIYIPGMEMPKEDEISKCFLIRHDGEVWVVEFDNLISDLGYVACYPTNPAKAIPVPDHGDLIDRDKLEKDIDRYIGGEESRSRFHHWVQVQDAVIPMDKGEKK